MSLMADSPTTASPPRPPGSTRAGEGFVELLGRTMYRIPGFDEMPPFLMNVVSDSDVWAYVSSRGGLTAGRVEPANCLFPYDTDDKLHQCHPFTGPQTLLRVARGEAEPVLWRPLRGAAGSDCRRTLYKSVEGTQLVFEELREDLGLRFRYRWAPTDRFGLVRTAWLDNLDAQRPASIEVVDGLLNILPAGVPLVTLQRASCLVNAYIQAEADRGTGLAIYSLTSKISDAAEPGESLHANVVWSHGLPDARLWLTPRSLERFERGEDPPAEAMVRNRRPGYLAAARLTLEPGGSARWHVAADAQLSQERVVALRAVLRDKAKLDAAIDQAVDQTTRNLRANVASADGLQHTADRMATAHHFANVMFNNMRGGVIAGGCRIDPADLVGFARVRHRPAADRLAAVAAGLGPGPIDVHALRDAAEATGDADVIRLCLEYLPITFGRRHGDPSRPWNTFAIRVRTPEGKRVLDYQGNWRDIFQNWEALGQSFPSYVDGMIAKFVSASTADGFNPYRISREGIDWEVPDPDDPWGNIGYWGDHQLIYLLKLMELSHRHEPAGLRRMLRMPVFATANVPYRLRGFDALVAQPRNTIDYDADLAKRIADRVEALGTDGRLVLGADGAVHHTTLAEKLLVSLLAKLSNLVVGGGVWMNTQRPEWNDANNALAGFGLSVVTTAYLHRYARFVRGLLDGAGHAPLPVSEPAARWLGAVAETLDRHQADLDAGRVDDRVRMAILRELGEAFEAYRAAVYHGEPGPAADLPRDEAVKLLDLAAAYSRHAVEASRRDDGLYHSYNLVSFDDDKQAARVHHLGPMLEGQVAVLSSGVLGPGEAADVLGALFDSDLYRPDAGTFMLYPYRDLPAYLDRSVVPDDAVAGNPLLSALLEAGDTSVIVRDADGRRRFASGFHSAEDLGQALDRLAEAPRFGELVAAHRRQTLDAYEDLFHHHAFTGRSGAMYGYEGLGCVYWHMVSKLLLAAQECAFQAVGEARGGSAARLRELYYRVRGGLGFEKSARDYGAFPTDPYSHTPYDRGAQQPGMTGQVKEEVLTRAGELGLTVDAGRLRFDPLLLRRREFFDEPTRFGYVDVHGEARSLDLPAGSLALTCCQTPIVYRLPGAGAGADAADAGSDAAGAEAPPGPRITAVLADGTTRTTPGLTLDADTSRAILHRTGAVTRLEVDLSALPAGD